MKTGSRHKFGVKVNMDLNNHCLVSALNELFHIHVNVELRSWSLRLYVSYIGPKKYATNFMYEVKVVSKEKYRKMTYSRTTHSNFDKHSGPSCRKDCFYLCLDQVVNCMRNKEGHCDPYDLFKFTVTIWPNSVMQSEHDSSD